MLMWCVFLSWLMLEIVLIRFIVVLTKEKQAIIKQLKDVKQEVINSTSDLLSMTETSQQEEEEQESEDWWE